jgi:hypothetical protein
MASREKARTGVKSPTQAKLGAAPVNTAKSVTEGNGACSGAGAWFSVTGFRGELA